MLFGDGGHFTRCCLEIEVTSLVCEFISKWNSFPSHPLSSRRVYGHMANMPEDCHAALTLACIHYLRFLAAEYFRLRPFTENLFLSFWVVLVELSTGEKEEKSLASGFVSHMENSCASDIEDSGVPKEHSKEELQLQTWQNNVQIWMERKRLTIVRSFSRARSCQIISFVL